MPDGVEAMRALGAVLLALALAGCGTSTQTPQTPTSSTTTAPADKAAACKAALVKLYQDAMTSTKTGAPPMECQGVPAATVEKFVGEIVTDALNSMTETTSP